LKTKYQGAKPVSFLKTSEQHYFSSRTDSLAKGGRKLWKISI